MFVLFVCPIFSPAASQMIEAALNDPQVRLGVIAQQPQSALAPSLAARIAAHWQVEDVTDAAALERAVRALGAQYGAAYGAVVRCFGAYEQLQLPLAMVRERLGIPGLTSEAAHNFRDKARMKDALRSAGVIREVERSCRGLATRQCGGPSLWDLPQRRRGRQRHGNRR